MSITTKLHAKIKDLRKTRETLHANIATMDSNKNEGPREYMLSVIEFLKAKGFTNFDVSSYGVYFDCDMPIGDKGETENIEIEVYKYKSVLGNKHKLDVFELQKYFKLFRDIHNATNEKAEDLRTSFLNNEQVKKTYSDQMEDIRKTEVDLMFKYAENFVWKGVHKPSKYGLKFKYPNMDTLVVNSITKSGKYKVTTVDEYNKKSKNGIWESDKFFEFVESNYYNFLIILDSATESTTAEGA